ncbi:hypothetical protein [Diaphorobacter aerolatus]|uniref:hypothetical protein n=1 Tax=Diaphorobacter aerolatus TaxID=1288495 RepID=UPI001D004D93|nr:hypothetical protein [Diaphorobacter aerolatus]
MLRASRGNSATAMGMETGSAVFWRASEVAGAQTGTVINKAYAKPAKPVLRPVPCADTATAFNINDTFRKLRVYPEFRGNSLTQTPAKSKGLLKN